MATTETYTRIRDGQVTWYAESAALVTAFVRGGWTPDPYQGYDAIAQPAVDDDDEIEPGTTDPYSLLCAAVTPIDEDEIPDGTLLETVEYDPCAVGEHRLRVSYDLYAAIFAAGEVPA
ncbi:MAG: hypothetical protein WCE44_02735 [Candidatus Velthaea sp.]